MYFIWDIRKGIDKKERKREYENLEISSRYFINYFKCICFFQSVLVGTANTMSANGEVGGSAGVFVSIFMLAGGIVSIAVRNSQKNGGNIAVVILFLLASFLGIGLAGSFSDLNVWAGWCLINAVLAIISIFK